MKQIDSNESVRNCKKMQTKAVVSCSTLSALKIHTFVCVGISVVKMGVLCMVYSIIVRRLFWNERGKWHCDNNICYWTEFCHFVINWHASLYKMQMNVKEKPSKYMRIIWLNFLFILKPFFARESILSRQKSRKILFCSMKNWFAIFVMRLGLAASLCKILLMIIDNTHTQSSQTYEHFYRKKCRTFLIKWFL